MKIAVYWYFGRIIPIGQALVRWRILAYLRMAAEVRRFSYDVTLAGRCLIGRVYPAFFVAAGYQLPSGTVSLDVEVRDESVRWDDGIQQHHYRSRTAISHFVKANDNTPTTFTCLADR